MPLFQHSVLKKFLGELDKDALEAAWQKFQAHFRNAAIKQNISHAKEEEYQEGFVRDLFVNVLGYTLKPQPDYNLVLEQKSTSDATKSDGAILSPEGNVVAVIELKDTTTTDLGKVERQAFGYKHQHKDCRYVITSNFLQLRLYIDDAIDFEPFDLFRLDKNSFALLYCCLQQKALQHDVPLKMKQQSVAVEENITRKLYEDYSRFKKLLFENITGQNPQFDKLLLFKKTQKLLDRFLFILFAEDRGLLPPNSVRDILSQWDQLKELDNYVPLYERFKKYFGYLNTGYKGKQHEIFAYNGGLFVADEILDNIVIDDKLLYDSCKGLSNYDFESEVDVNILGHIFEHSLNEIEEIEQQLTSPLSLGGRTGERPPSKRKKDGVFYTPRYITKYIVENTVGALCIQKRNELNIIDEEFAPQKRKANTQQLLQKLEEYRAWLLQLTICDPACGSGAFLNQALEFLIAEHQSIDALKAKLFGDAIVLSDVENSILENNLYGVDINEEAVEIAKLSLWLRTARKGRKLNSLNQHIKCGNSLIDDAAIAGDKAFNWQKEFPEVFEKGGFDVVVGNPPWGATLSDESKVYLNKVYKSSSGESESYIYFTEMAFEKLVKTNGFFSFITPNTWFYLEKFESLRNYFLGFNILQLVELEKRIFEDAPDIIPVIFIIYKKPFTNSSITCYKLKKGCLPTFLIDESIFSDNNINKEQWLAIKGTPFNLLLSLNKSKIIKKLSNYPKLSNSYIVRYGIKTGNNERYVSKHFSNDFKLCLPAASTVKRYLINWEGDYLNFGSHLSGFSNNSFEKPKILIQYIRKLSMDRRLIVALDEQGIYYPLNNFSFIEAKKDEFDLKYLLNILNSDLMNFYFANNFIDYNIKPKYIEQLPIKIIPPEQQLPFIIKADIMLSKNKELQQLKQSLLQLLQSKYEGITFSKKLQDWPGLPFSQFLKELDKQKIKLSLAGQAEWMQYFETEKSKANAVQHLINNTDKEIDEMVYELYGLTEEERRVVEEG